MLLLSRKKTLSCMIYKLHVCNIHGDVHLASRYYHAKYEFLNLHRFEIYMDTSALTPNGGLINGVGALSPGKWDKHIRPDATQIKLEEPKWLSGGSHTSVFNGGLLGSHFGSPGDPDTCIRVLNRLHVNVKGTKWSNGSHGSLKSSFTFMCVAPAYFSV